MRVFWGFQERYRVSKGFLTTFQSVSEYFHGISEALQGYLATLWKCFKGFKGNYKELSEACQGVSEDFHAVFRVVKEDVKETLRL